MFWESYYWNYLIFSYLFGALFFVFLIYKDSKNKWIGLKTKNKIFRISSSLFFLIFFATIFYGSFIAPYLVEIKTVKIDFNTTQENEKIKLVQLTDLHAGPYKNDNFFSKINDQLKLIKPDLIVFTGDYIYNKEKEAKVMYNFQDTAQTIPSYAITGNHEFSQGSAEQKILDKTDLLKKILRETNIKLIDNKSELINKNGHEFLLSGIKDIWSQDSVNEQQLLNLHQNNTKNLPHILLAHNPDTILYENSKYFDLILSGHTHGGQIRLPFWGSISNIPNKLGRDYDFGLFNLNNNNFLYISKGIGESGPRARLFCRPEITVIELDL